MPKIKPFVSEIESFYISNTEDVMLFSWVEAITTVLPAVEIQSAIEMFKKRYGLSEDDFPLESAKFAYQRTKEKFNRMKSKGK